MENNLVEQVLKLYNIKSLDELSKDIDVPLSTLKTWRRGVISRLGERLMTLMIENYELKQKVGAVTHFLEAFGINGDKATK